MLTFGQHSSFSPANLFSLASVDEQNFDKLRDAYNACMDEATIKKAGIKPLMELVHEVADMFPVSESSSQGRNSITVADKKELSNVLILLAKWGVMPIVAVGASADDKDPDKVVVVASDPSRIGLPAKDYYLDSSVVEMYQNMLEEEIGLLHPDHKDENATLHSSWMKSTGHSKVAARGGAKFYAQAVVDFEKKLAAATPDEADRNDVTVSQHHLPT